MATEDNDYPHIRKQFDLEWRATARRFDLGLNPERQAELKRAHNERLSQALDQARKHDKAIRERQSEVGGSIPDQFTAGVERRNRQRDNRQGYKGDDVLTPKVVDRFAEDVEAYGRPTKKTLDRVTDRLNAQFPSESSIYPQQSSGAVAAAISLMAGKAADNAE